MITIINKYTGEVITKYSNALVSEATGDSFIANVKGSASFRSRWHAVVDYFQPLTGAVQCTLKCQFAVLEKLTEEDKRYW